MSRRGNPWHLLEAASAALQYPKTCCGKPTVRKRVKRSRAEWLAIPTEEIRCEDCEHFADKGVS